MVALVYTKFPSRLCGWCRLINAHDFLHPSAGSITASGLIVRIGGDAQTRTFDRSH
jgi:hypothetical protein